ncbi:MAG: histidinol-phosphate transaminase [Candidatus Omnitrophica bacterium]|nr:histidinol-phosphate transaminase [Candidatus Omnitrophota bacterium]MCF7877515.1 histidinol-phosphate transaminase [Candidatus Omnitrophota bacterium]MCF7878430.1 histidinol-phosphate transaminase [Candidatus Omnitrophota bacterium]MCF7892925.1 histidinol-phosphate transaminase [Candidatus Omnitrophota bacterium]
MKYRKELDKINSYKPGKPIEELRREKRLTKIYKLASNEIPFQPDFIKDAVNKELKNINRYPESSCFYLREKLAKNFKINPDSIVFGNGSDEIITLALKTFIGKKDEVIIAYPSFLVYQIQAQIFGAKVIKAPLENYSYCLERIAKKITKKTKIIFIANPDNPTGTYINQEKMDNFLKKVPKNVLLFFDEAYFEFAPADFPKSIDILTRRKNIIITRTFSKAYGLAGLRIGYGITSKKIAKLLNKVREPFNVNRIAQVSAQAALENKDFVKKVVSFINKEKSYFYKNLDRLGLSYPESAANFILVDFKKDTKKLYEYMLNQGIIIRELSGWGLDNFFRVTMGTRTQNRKFIKSLENYIRRMRK